MTTAPELTVPQELVELILVDFDPIDDRQSLLQISMVQMNFVGPAQRLIFHTLAVYGDGCYPEGRDMTLLRAVPLFSDSPHLAHYVRSLTLKLGIDSGLPEQDLAGRLLDALSGVQNFVFNASRTKWDLLDAQFTTRLLRFVAAPQMAHLNLIGVFAVPHSVFTTLLCAAPVLSLHSVTLPENTVDALPPSSTHVCRLENVRLMFRSSISLCRFLTRSPMLRNLRKLTMQNFHDHYTLLAQVSPTLEQLHIKCTHRYADFDSGEATPADLSALPSLRILSFEMPVGDEFGSTARALHLPPLPPSMPGRVSLSSAPTLRLPLLPPSIPPRASLAINFVLSPFFFDDPDTLIFRGEMNVSALTEYIKRIAIMPNPPAGLRWNLVFPHRVASPAESQIYEDTVQLFRAVLRESVPLLVEDGKVELLTSVGTSYWDPTPEPKLLSQTTLSMDPGASFESR
ncbi:hypothetical protein C8R46DRAFT_1322294 [Mycena filopes]|nr:hypothetical protein C8R46DRAFT_1322294 [Mycena filopes]